MDFYINKTATLPTLKMELIQDGRNDYKNFHEKIQNANIFFTMTDVVTGVKRIGKSPATCMLKEVPVDCDEEYYIIYQWSERDTKKAGTYVGKFTIEFLDGSGTLIVPIREELMIHILEGSIKK
jgi:hypothetical protein